MIEVLGIDRRGLLERVMLLTGAMATPGFGATALAQATKGASRFLDASTFALLGAVADTIVPRTDTAGAIEAGVPASFDSLLANWASPQHRYELSQSLAKIDGAARQDHSAGFVDLPPAVRTLLLSAYDASTLEPARHAGRTASDPGYKRLKELIVTLYYLSEPALTQELSYVHVPGQWKPSIPVTATTRPAGGPN
jgi:hypothetical protein